MNIEKMTDQEIVELAAQYGPGVIGPEIHARAKAITAKNPGGQFGPALIDTEGPKKAVAVDEDTPKKPAKGKKG